MRKLSIAALLFAIVSLGACSYTAPVTATSVDYSPSNKVGKAKCWRVLGLFVGGDCSVAAAATNGQITKISTVDSKNTNYLGFYISNETIVSGQ